MPSILIRSLLVGSTIAAVVWLFASIIQAALGWWEKLHPPCNLPILNLDGWHFERARKEYVTNLGHYLEIGRTKYKDSGYQLWSPEGWKVILPPRYYEEAGMLGDDVVSNSVVGDRILGGYNMVDRVPGDFEMTVAVCKKHLQSSVAALGDRPCQEVQANMLSQLPRMDEWNEVVFFPTILSTIASAVTTTLFGEELGRDPKLLQAAKTFPSDAINAGLRLRKLTYYPMKFFFAELGLIPEVVSVRNWLKYARTVVPPVLKARSEAAKNDPTYDKPKDFIQWLYDYIGQLDQGALERIGQGPMFAMSAAVHSTSMNIVNLVHHIAWYPEYNASLREEIDKVLEESNGSIDSAAAAKLDKLDSYIMDASRHPGFKRVNLDRNVTAKNGYTFPDGLHLRKGACFALDMSGMELDPELYGDPHEFVPFRYSDARARAGPTERKIYFTSTSPKDALQFGYGKHSCPGRGFATLMIKIFVATLLHGYDVEPLPGTSFPKPVDRGTIALPPMSVTLRFRKRKV